MNRIVRHNINKHHQAIARWERRPKLMTAAYLFGAIVGLFSNVQRVKEAWQKSTTTRTGERNDASRSTRGANGPRSLR